MSQLPAYLQAFEAPDVGAALSANLGSAMPPHVSIEGGRFTLIDASNNEIPVPTFDPKIGVYLDACIIDVNQAMSRMYYARPYDPANAAAPPDCWSDNGVGPSVGASSPQSPTCAACPQAVWGSKINANGKKVPACSQKQKVALLIPGYNTLFLLAVPPNSHSFLREYVEKCKGSQINMANLITRISFVQGVQGTLQFQAVSYIDEPTARLRQAAYAEKKTGALLGRNDVARQALPAPITQIPVGGTGQAPLLASPQHPTSVMTPDPRFSDNTVRPGVEFQQSVPFQSEGTAPQATTTTAASATPASTTDPAPTQRRRRRTAAEMAQANGAAPAGQGAVAPAQAASGPASPGPQAPFPVPGQPAQQANFGIAQPSAPDPELKGMLDDFFAQS